MLQPVQITFRDIPPSPAVTDRIRKKVAELERFDDRILACRVLVEAHHRRHQTGKLYHVRVDVTVPGVDIVVNRDPDAAREHEDVYVALRDAFAAAARQIEDHARRQRGDTKIHEVPPHGRIARLFRRAGYGFIESSDGTYVYFHKNSVVGAEFERLRIGSEVRFVPHVGESDRGLQASSVRPVGERRHLPNIDLMPS